MIATLWIIGRNSRTESAQLWAPSPLRHAPVATISTVGGSPPLNAVLATRQAHVSKIWSPVRLRVTRPGSHHLWSHSNLASSRLHLIDHAGAIGRWTLSTTRYIRASKTKSCRTGSAYSNKSWSSGTRSRWRFWIDSCTTRAATRTQSIPWPRHSIQTTHESSNPSSTLTSQASSTLSRARTKSASWWSSNSLALRRSSVCTTRWRLGPS